MERPAGREWLSRLPDRVERQRAVLRQLLRLVEAHEEYRWLELAGSLGREAGDQLSDIDAGIGVTDRHWPAAVDRIERQLDEIAPVIDRFRQAMPVQDGESAWHLVTLYRSTESDSLGVQLSLVVFQASWRKGLPPGAVALYDVDGRLSVPWEPSVLRADSRTVTEWDHLAWVALGDLAKYLDRDSRWEAHAALEKARGHLWQLVAHQQEADYPSFGLTSVLDTDAPALPTGIERTVAGLDPEELRTAGLELAGVLERLRGVRPPFGDWVLDRLRSG